jgi:hypothetical protein
LPISGKRIPDVAIDNALGYLFKAFLAERETIEAELHKHYSEDDDIFAQLTAIARVH